MAALFVRASVRAAAIDVGFDATDVVGARLHKRETLALYQPLDPASEIVAQLLIRIAPDAAGVTRQGDAAASSHRRARRCQNRQRRRCARARGPATADRGDAGRHGRRRRTREMGIRTAPGAAPSDLMRLLMWESLRPVVSGLALGAGAAVLAGRVVVATMFFGVPAHDPLALAGAAAVLLAAAALAVIVPARRAAVVDPPLVLRSS